MWGRCGPNLRWVLVRLMGGGLCVNPHGTCLRGTVSTSPYSLGSKAGPGAGGGGGYAEDAWCVCALSPVRFFETSWTRAHQAPLSTGFARQEYWSGLPFLSPGHLSDPGIKPMSPVSPTLAA